MPKKSIIEVGLWTMVDFDITPRFRHRIGTRSRLSQPRRRARF
jgi:hypothetical protein